jgi:hypothetical protein
LQETNTPRLNEGSEFGPERIMRSRHSDIWLWNQYSLYALKFGLYGGIRTTLLSVLWWCCHAVE